MEGGDDGGASKAVLIDITFLIKYRMLHLMIP